VWRLHSSDWGSSGYARSKAASKRGGTWGSRSKMLAAVALFVCSGALAANGTAAAAIAPGVGEEPYKQPQLAIAHGILAVTWGSGNAVRFAKSTDDGKSFSAPVTVSDEGVISLGNHRGPRIVMTPDAIVISAIYGAKGRGADGDLIAWRSTDGGTTWSKGTRINDRAAAAREGLHAMAADGKVIWAVWLDDRAGGKELWGASSSDGGATWSANRKIYSSPDGHICECCHPSVVVRNQGRTVYAMFRNWLGGARDLYLAASHDGGRTFEVNKLGQGTWQLNACPMDGGALVVDKGGPVTVWRRQSTVYLARPGSPEDEVGPGKNAAMAGHTIVWSSPDGLRVRRGGHGSVLIDPKGAFPAAASGGGRDAIAWEDAGRLMIQVFSR
jgi:hypothetical protein